MSIYYNPDKKEFQDVTWDGEIPDSWQKINLNALEFYTANADYYDIDLNKINGLITIAKIKEFGVNTETLRNVRLNEINSRCKEQIYEGIDIETSKGPKHFSLTDEDHREILELMLHDIPEYEYHADGESYTIWANEEFKKITDALLAHKNSHRKHCNVLRSQIMNMNLEELWDVTYQFES